MSLALTAFVPRAGLGVMGSLELGEEASQDGALNARG